MWHEQLAERASCRIHGPAPVDRQAFAACGILELLAHGAFRIAVHERVKIRP